MIPCMKRFERHKSIGIAIGAIYRSSTAQVTEKLKQYNVTSNQIPYFMIIARREKTSQDDIAKELMVNKANVTRAIQKLITLGLVKREKAQNDKRIYLLSLTKKGYQLLPEFRTTLRGWWGTILADIPLEDQEKLADTLSKTLSKINEIRGNNEET